MTATWVGLLLAIPLAQPGQGPDTVVVCEAEFREAMRPWLEYRTQQGHEILLIPGGTGEQIRQQVRGAARGGRLRFVVLVGTARMGMEDGVRLAPAVPVHYARARVNVLWGSEPYIATDNPYGDLDDDLVTDVAVGRLAAATPSELATIVAKTLAYERSADFGPWRRQVNLVAGVGGFSPLVDMVLESATRYFMTRNIPADYQTTVTYASWRSPYCPDPRLFHATTLERLNEGSWFWVYVGHGFHLGLDRMQVPAGDYPILSTADTPQLRCRHMAPIALFLACYTGAFDARDECLAEQMVHAPGGPVAVVAGSRVTMPYAMAVMSSELMKECFQRRTETLGEALLHAKRNMLQDPPPGNVERATLDALASAISPDPKQLAAERAEHVLLFNLLGDPLLRLRYPRPVEIHAEAATAGGRLRVAGTTSVDGPCLVELVSPRGMLTFTPPPRPQYPQGSAELTQFQEVYRRANDGRWSAAQVLVRAGRFDAELAVPRAARGRCHLRVYVEGEDNFALGSAEVEIRPAENVETVAAE